MVFPVEHGDGLAGREVLALAGDHPVALARGDAAEGQQAFLVDGPGHVHATEGGEPGLDRHAVGVHQPELGARIGLAHHDVLDATLQADLEGGGVVEDDGRSLVPAPSAVVRGAGGDGDGDGRGRAR